MATSVPPAASAEHRIERDSLGEVRVPRHALWGAQTQRAIENFPISGLKPMPVYVRAQATIKRAAAEVNRDLGLLEPKLAAAILQAADEVIAGKWDDQFVVDPFQAGAGTSHNMNCNEVIANRANQILGCSIEDPKKPVDPNDHVNMAQSTNDTIPTAIRLGCLLRLHELTSALDKLAEAFRRKGAAWKEHVKSGRTHLQDAVPVTLGQEFHGYATSIARSRDKIVLAADGLRRLGIGGTATGSGLNAHPEYHARMVRKLGDLTGLELRGAEDLFECMQSMGDAVFFSAALRNLAVDLGRIANDLRLLASGPTTGFDEIRLPATQPGSSIMPGKVNPVMAEMTNMVCYHVIGNDACVQQAGQAGQLELNVMMPVIAYNLFQSMHLFIHCCETLRSRCIEGLEPQPQKAWGWLARNPILVTALNPVIGYQKGAEVAKTALKEGKTIREVVVEKGYLTAAEADRLLDARQMARGGIVTGGGGGGG
ncbi:MAG: aspartate ammonia-lyase [Planctomycetota bacterium]|nr:MAG: aspartate ammonia-lyase [Planctomycetota bacterium]